MAYECFDVDITAKAGHIKMSRPDNANSMIASFWRELPKTVDRMSASGSVRAIDMVSAADMRYAPDDAWFSIAEINIGMTADVGTLQRLPKLMPEGIVKELAYTGRKWTAAEIAAQRPMAIWGTKTSIHSTRDHGGRQSRIHRQLERRHVRHRRHGRSLRCPNGAKSPGLPRPLPTV